MQQQTMVEFVRSIPRQAEQQQAEQWQAEQQQAEQQQALLEKWGKFIGMNIYYMK